MIMSFFLPRSRLQRQESDESFVTAVQGDTSREEDVQQASTESTDGATLKLILNKLSGLEATTKRQDVEITELKKEKVEQATMIETQASEIKQLKTENAKQASEIKQLKTDNGKQASETKQLKKENAKQASETTELKKENEELKKKAIAHITKIKELEIKNRKIQSERRTMKKWTTLGQKGKRKPINTTNFTLA
jgi:predicted RNase H-like nuclease (RuvC/YqgF family)